MHPTLAGLSPSLIHEKYSKWLPTVITSVLVVACAWTVARVSLDLIDDYSSTDEAVVATPSVKRPAPRSSINNLTNAHLFGHTQSTATTVNKLAPKTKLSLVLRGVLVAKPVKLASAIISQRKGGKALTYSIDARIPGGAILREIHPDHVILEYHGRKESLYLVKDRDLNIAGTKSAIKPQGSQIASTAVQLRDIRNEIIKNPASFGKYAIPLPYRENGIFKGYRLKPRSKSGLMGQLGITPEDVITKINGIELDSPRKGLTALQKLRTAKEINLTVLRNGNEIPIQIALP